jgi:hypothetical protein
MFGWDGSFFTAKMEWNIPWLVLTILRRFYKILKDPVHHTDNRGRASEVLGNIKKAVLPHPLLGFFIHFNVSTTESVDALLGITYEKETLR